MVCVCWFGALVAGGSVIPLIFGFSILEIVAMYVRLGRSLFERIRTEFWPVLAGNSGVNVLVFSEIETLTLGLEK